MPIIYNIETAKIDIECTQGDSIQMNFQVTGLVTSFGIKVYIQAFNVPSLGIPIHLDNLQMTVRREDGLILKEWISIGSPSAISINPWVDGEFDLVDLDGFSESGYFNYDLQSTDGVYIGTLMSGIFHVKKQVTP